MHGSAPVECRAAWNRLISLPAFRWSTSPTAWTGPEGRGEGATALSEPAILDGFSPSLVFRIHQDSLHLVSLKAYSDPQQRLVFRQLSRANRLLLSALSAGKALSTTLVVRGADRWLSSPSAHWIRSFARTIFSTLRSARRYSEWL